MILFLEDWNKYPTAIMHLNTTNKSAVRFASLLREMGVENNAFMLALINPELEFVNPFDPNLTKAQRVAVGVECRINPWYYFREVARAPAESGDAATMVEFNRGNIALWWCFFNHVSTFLIQIRQTGKSFSTDSLMEYLIEVYCKNTTINLLTKDDDLRRENIKRMKAIGDELPAYMRFRQGDDSRNGEEITVKRLKNAYKTHVPQMAKKNALKMGRGLTTPIFHLDEPPFQPCIEIALPAALSSTGAAIDRAKAAGAPYGIIFTTTAGMKDTTEGKYFYGILCDAAVWSEKFFDSVDQPDLENTIRKTSRVREYSVNITLNHRQLGKTDEWLREKLERSKSKGDAANSDFFNIWSSGGLVSPFTSEQAEFMRSGQEDVVHTQICPENYVIRWYIPAHEIEERMRTSQTIAALDTSDCSGGDDTSILITDIETNETLGIATVNENNLITFAMFICSLIVKYKNMLTIIERKSSGPAILDYLLLLLPDHGEDPFRRLWNRVVHDYDVNKVSYEEICQPMGRRPSDIYVRYKKSFGFTTSATGLGSRSELYSTTLQNAIDRAGGTMYDKVLIDQVLSLTIRNGRVDHPPGEHDDHVIGWLLTYWILTLSKNLSFYGIDTKRISVAMQLQSRNNRSIGDEYQIAEQAYFRNRINELYTDLSNEQDPYVSRRIEHELKSINSKLILEDEDVFSLDELIKRANENKRARMRNASSRFGTPQPVRGLPQTVAVYADQVVNHNTYVPGRKY